MPAWLTIEPAAALEGDWDGLSAAVESLPVATIVERGRLLGLPVTALGPPVPRPGLVLDPAPSSTASPAGRAPRRLAAGSRPLVVDLTAMWAGPQCTQVLALAGCRVVKVEDPGRLDGTRRGPAAFFDLMQHGKESVVAPLRGPEVADLVAQADVVVTGARPRALRPLGLFPPPAPIWVAITGHGLEGPDAEAVGFGDDAAVAAGVVARDGDRADGRPLFCADALADPVAGLLAALGALSLLRDGRPGRVAVSLRDAAAQLLAVDAVDGPPDRTPPGEIALPRARSLADLDAAKG